MLLPWETKRTPTLQAHSGMPSEDFIANLRAFAIASGLSVRVIDHVDKLTSTDALEDAHAEELNKSEDEAVTRGRTEMKKEIMETVDEWTQEFVNDDLVETFEKLRSVIEKVET